MNYAIPKTLIILITFTTVISAGCDASPAQGVPPQATTPVIVGTPTTIHIPELTQTVILQPTPTVTTQHVGRQAIYWGAMVVENGRFAPWDTTVIDQFEEVAGKKMSILHWGQPWWFCDGDCGYQLFNYQLAQYETVRSRGMIPLLDWGSWNSRAPVTRDQPQFSLGSIISGTHDAYIREWATQARDWGHPFFLRFNWEMNGDWYPWSETRNGNHVGQYVQAYQHVHDIFNAVGTKNATWVWCPNIDYAGGAAIEPLYPGNDYVDWMCMDGYNKGLNTSQPDMWKSFQEVFGPTYRQLFRINPNKPIMLAEVASTEVGGSKAEWITDALLYQLPTRFPNVGAMIWFNWYADGMDWLVDTSQSSQKAFAEAIASPYYTSNEFAQFDVSPIPPVKLLP